MKPKKKDNFDEVMDEQFQMGIQSERKRVCEIIKSIKLLEKERNITSGCVIKVLEELKALLSKEFKPKKAEKEKEKNGK